MTKTKFLLIAAVLAIVAWAGASSAVADGHEQTMTVDPSMVAEPGTYDFTLSASGFTIPSANLATCSTGDASLLLGIAELTQYCGGIGDTVSIGADGTFTTTVEGVEVGEDGVTFLLFQLVQDGEAASASVNIGMMGDELANTGLNTSLLVVIGMGMALAGVMVLGLSRRLRAL
ncbi:hypothetical protein [Candidatus Poriferisocius sp.]|uniref:hypothetical protein n=1 Tax=Candidatus Poriferisocius sp. TaxID=3101276 RepID=UPI003B02811B